MNFRPIFALAVLIWYLAAALGFAAGPLVRYESSVDAMGSTFSIAAWGRDRDSLAATVESALEEARRLDRVLSNYRPESEWSQINKSASSRDVTVSQELFDLLAACVSYSQRSEGAFDITVGPLMRIWGFYKGSGHLPHRAQVRTALARTGYKNIVLNATNRTVRFAIDGLEIDPGGIGKGYAVDKMAAMLQTAGVPAALINAGGSSIYAAGAPPDEPRGWQVLIRDPKNATKTAAAVYLKNQSMSTSGSYEKFFRAGKRTYSHIMDPRTGYPAPGMYSVSVVSPRALDSEAWTKPVYIHGRQWAANHLPSGYRAYLCEDRGEAKCAWLQ
ncbi:MAG: FAD:protein FMN transferase [Acidobacteria bacterium]|nr:FAD:protein FMN transferase [Acidobacteriota bacterium]